MKNTNISSKIFRLGKLQYTLGLSLLWLIGGNMAADAQAETLEAIVLTDLPSNSVVSSESLASVKEITIKAIEVTGNTVLQDKINNFSQSFVGKTIPLTDVEKLADSLTEIYLNEGYITSKAIIPNQDFSDGIVKIEVQEGSVESVVIKGASRLENYVRSRIGIGIKTPLKSGQLEDQLRLLKSNPLFENVEATLKAGSEDNKSILEVYVDEANPFFGSVGIDNYSTPSVGSFEANLNLGYRNVFGIGDGISVEYSPRLETFTGTYQVDTIYQVPVNAMNGTVQLRATIEENEVVNGDFEYLDISGESQYYEISYRQPIIRNPRQELALSLGMSYRNGQTFTFAGPFPFGYGPDEDGITRTNVVTFGQDYVSRETKGAWAFRSQFRIGTGLFDVTNNPSGIPDGYFFSWLGQIQRAQVLSKNHFLVVQGDVQLTPDPLLPSEQFTIGGAESVRGYRQNARSGDNGFRVSVQDNITLIRNKEDNPVFLMTPFLDLGYVWNDSENPNYQYSKTFLVGLGLGFLWQPISGMSVAINYAPPLVYLDDRIDDLQDNGLYFSVNYKF